MRFLVKEILNRAAWANGKTIGKRDNTECVYKLNMMIVVIESRVRLNDTLMGFLQFSDKQIATKANVA